MKVLFIYDDFPLSSEDTVGCFVLEEATNLVKRNVELLVFKPLLGLGCIEVSGIEVVGLKGAQDLRGGILHRVFLMFKLFKSIPLLGKYIVKHPKGAYRLLKMGFLAAKIVRNKQVDVIHAHFAYPNGLIGAIAKQLSKKPLVVSLRGVDLMVEPSIGYGLRLNRDLEQLITKVLLIADSLVTVSSFVQKEALRLMGDIITEKLHYIPNAVDIQRYNLHIDGKTIREKVGLKAEHRIILSVKHLKKVAGFEYLIKAFPMVKTRHPEAKLVICGRDYKGMKAKLQELAKRLGIEEDVIFVGEVKRSDIPYYFAACDVFVIPSLSEGMPNAALEAMACGKPIVATNVGGLPEIVIDGVNGFLVKPKDPEALAEKICILLDNEEVRLKMGKKSFEIVRTKYNYDRKVDDILRVYSSLLPAKTLSPVL